MRMLLVAVLLALNIGSASAAGMPYYNTIFSVPDRYPHQTIYVPPRLALPLGVNSASLPVPPYLVNQRARNFQTYAKRVTDSAAFGGGSQWFRHEYSKKQVWNSIETMILLKFPQLHYYLMSSFYKLVAGQFVEVNGPNDMFLWSNKDPDIIYGAGIGQGPTNPAALVKYHVSTDVSTVVHTFAGAAYTSIQIGTNEGAQSDDDVLFPILGIFADSSFDIMVYNIVTDTVGSVVHFANTTSWDWFAMSHSGKYAVLADNNGFLIYSVNSATLGLSLLRTSAAGNPGSHADLCYDQAGNEVLFLGGDGGNAQLSTYRLSDDVKTIQIPTATENFNFHISCRNTARPGWAYVSHFDTSTCGQGGSDNGSLAFQEIYAVRLDGSGVVERWGQDFKSLNATVNCYQHDPFATPNHDGTKVMFASDWGGAPDVNNVYDYVLSMRPN